jgi:two-component system, LytTR family, response regulator
MSSSEQMAIFENYRNILSDWLPEGASIAIALQDTFVYFASGHANISLLVGSKVPPDSMAYRVLADRKKVDAIMETTLFNTPYYAIGYPIHLFGQIGALIIVLPPHFKPEQSTLELITGKEEDDLIPIAIKDIYYFESLQKKTWIYRNKKQYKTTITLKELETRLPNYFVRIHRSYIVNLHFIERVSKDFSSNYIIYMQNGEELPVSQSYVNVLKTALEI